MNINEKLVYLDNNIIVDIENNRYTLDDVIQHCKLDEHKLPFSYAHIFEMLETKGNNKEENLKKRKCTINNITKGKYLFHDQTNNNILLQSKSSEEVTDTINEIPPGTTSIMKSFVNLINKEQKDEYRSHIGIESKEINNYSPSEVIEHLSTKLKISHEGMSFIDIINFAMKSVETFMNVSLLHYYTAIFELLDMLGYWKDKQTDKSNYARVWDSTHAYFGGFCRYFISRDRNTRYKAKVVYSLLELETIVMSPDGKIVEKS